MKYIAIALLLFGLIGCQSQTPRRIVETSPDRAPRMKSAPYYAEYVLVSRQPRTEQGELWAKHLYRGQRIGFRASADGSLVAVAADEHMPLPAGHYRWQTRPGTEGQNPVHFWSGVAGGVLTGTAIVVGLIAYAFSQTFSG